MRPRFCRLCSGWVDPGKPANHCQEKREFNLCRFSSCSKKSTSSRLRIYRRGGKRSILSRHDAGRVNQAWLVLGQNGDSWRCTRCDGSPLHVEIALRVTKSEGDWCDLGIYFADTRQGSWIYDSAHFLDFFEDQITHSYLLWYPLKFMVYNTIAYYCFDSIGHSSHFYIEICMPHCLARAESLSGASIRWPILWIASLHEYV